MTKKASREQQAFGAISESFYKGKKDSEIYEYIEHHLDELPKSYWKTHLNTKKPTHEDVLNLLICRGSWEFDGSEYFDFTLPDDATNYMICVAFNEKGNITDISMES